jgi:hypothetical protein
VGSLYLGEAVGSLRYHAMTLRPDLTGENLRPFFRGDRLSFRPGAAQQVVDAQPVNLDFSITRPEAKRISLPSILTPTDFDQRLTFRDRVSYPLDYISLPADHSIKRQC